VRYISTRGEAPRLGFSEAMLVGLARDGGLYTPLKPPLASPAEIRALSGLSYAEAATRLIAPFVDDEIDRAELAALAEWWKKHDAAERYTMIDGERVRRIYTKKWK